MTLLQRLLGGALAVLFLLAVLVFASLALGVLLAAGLVLWGWLWWRTRSLRKGGDVIEGEYRDETPKPLLPERDRRL
jgi:HAMP domain-containing protein